MGRHEAADGATTHPLVAEALHRRPRDAPRGVHEAEPLPGREGPIGWPGPDPDQGGEPVGWPGSQAAERGTAAPVQPATAARRWWLRLLSRPTAA